MDGLHTITEIVKTAVKYFEDSALPNYFEDAEDEFKETGYRDAEHWIYLSMKLWLENNTE